MLQNIQLALTIYREINNPNSTYLELSDIIFYTEIYI